MPKPSVADVRLNLLRRNNRCPARASRAVSLRTSAASLAPQHLLAASQQHQHTEAGDRLQATTELDLFFFWQHFAFFAGLAQGKQAGF